MDYVTKLKKEIISLLEENQNIDTIGFIYQYLIKLDIYLPLLLHFPKYIFH